MRTAIWIDLSCFFCFCSGIEVYNGKVIFYCLGNLFFQTKTECGFYSQEVW
jgi:poly-gamma-glutamate capsule biosynthesis protein CapA/YwtB (metallophosphatase superfamily)